MWRGEFVSIEVEFNLKWKKVHESWLNMHSFPIKFKDTRRIARKTRESRSNRLGTGLELSLSQCRLFRSWILFVILSSIYFYSVSFFSSCWERQKVSLQAEAITVTQLKYGLRFTVFYEWMLKLNVQFTVTSLSENAIPIGFFLAFFHFRRCVNRVHAAPLGALWRSAAQMVPCAMQRFRCFHHAFYI